LAFPWGAWFPIFPAPGRGAPVFLTSSPIFFCCGHIGLPYPPRFFPSFISRRARPLPLLICYRARPALDNGWCFERVTDALAACLTNFDSTSHNKTSDLKNSPRCRCVQKNQCQPPGHHSLHKLSPITVLKLDAPPPGALFRRSRTGAQECPTSSKHASPTICPGQNGRPSTSVEARHTPTTAD